MTKRYHSRSATRVDFAGGTLDLWPISAIQKGAQTLNASIDCYTRVEYVPSEKEIYKIQVESPDFSESFEFNSKKDFFLDQDSKLSLLQEALKAFENKKISTSADETTKVFLGFGEWTLKSESPAGSGLGGSSSLLISILKVIDEFLELSFKEADFIETAKNIESRVLKSPAGIQDYFSPIKEGLNCISFETDGFVRSRLPAEIFDFWKARLTLVDSCIKHHSGMNNWEILKKFIEQEPQTLKALEDLVEVSSKVKVALEVKSIESLALAFDQELKAREKVSASYLNEELKVLIGQIESLPQVKALKVCGAGGGGCILILHEVEDKLALHEELKKLSCELLPFSLSSEKTSELS